MYVATTRMIRVTVTPSFLAEESLPAENRYTWAYQVEITNEGPISVQLRSRYWKIVDGLGRVQEVRGPGVVGEEPVIPPGGSFRYTSGCPLGTPSGFMVGAYHMQAETGDWFSVDIPAFSLDMPDGKRVMN